MRVVITRPQASARRTAERLRALGHQPVLMPLARAVHHPEIARAALGRPHAALAITSAEAIRVLAAISDPIRPHFADIVYAVGAATAKAAEAAGFRDIRTGPGTGTELAGMIAGDGLDFRDPLLYLAGRPRSPNLEEGLRSGSIPHVAAEIYDMAPIAYDADAIYRLLFEPREADAVLLYSRETAAAFFTLVAFSRNHISGMRFLCLSADIAETVPGEFHRNIEIARHPDETSVFALL